MLVIADFIMKSKPVFMLLILLPLFGISQKADFLPKYNLWTTQTLNPIASQSYGQVDAVGWVIRLKENDSRPQCK
jgi:hypothetical protein